MIQTSYLLYLASPTPIPFFLASSIKLFFDLEILSIVAWSPPISHASHRFRPYPSFHPYPLIFQSSRPPCLSHIFVLFREGWKLRPNNLKGQIWEHFLLIIYVPYRWSTGNWAYRSDIVWSPNTNTITSPAQSPCKGISAYQQTHRVQDENETSSLIYHRLKYREKIWLGKWLEWLDCMEYYFHFCDQFMGTQGRMSSFSLGAP